MANYNHIQFSPDFNRLKGGSAGIFAKAKPPKIAQHPVDSDDPYTNIHLGLFKGCAEDNKGKTREYVFYIPRTMKTSGNSMFVFAGKGQTAQQFFDSFNWSEVLEKHEVTGIFVAPNGDWNKENPGDEIDWFLRVYQDVMNMEYYASNAPALYTLGFDSGAYMSALFTILYSSKFASFATYGECSMSDELLDIIGRLPSDGDPAIMKSQTPLPAWIIDGSESGKKLTLFMKKANSSMEENLYNDVAKVWYPRPKPGELYLNGQCVNQVWYSEHAPLEGNELIDRMTGFVTSFKRWGGEGNSHIRLSKSPKDMGLKKIDIVVDGLKRYFYIFEPTAYKRGLKDEYPLVVAIHGFSCSGHFFAENSGWEAVAEERGFFVVFPTAYPYLRPDSVTCPTPFWNTRPHSADNKAPDDLSFFKALLNTVKSRYPVDDARIYAAGHSNGSAMTQSLMRNMPKDFAAFAPIGGMEAAFTGKADPMPDDTVRPVWFMLGENDLGEGDKLTPGGGNDITLRNICACNKADFDKASRYESGIYRHIVAYNADRTIPLVRFTGIANFPHSVTPEMSLMLWDEFFCKFTRGNDGSSHYIG